MSTFISFQPIPKISDEMPGPAPTVTVKKLTQRESMSPTKNKWDKYISVDTSTCQYSPKQPHINTQSGQIPVMAARASSPPPIIIVKNPHNEPYKKDVHRRRASNIKNSNADMIHIMADGKANSKMKKYHDGIS